ncbi:hypothetical protein Tco_1512904, partial [Tanacetum coccineum]
VVAANARELTNVFNASSPAFGNSKILKDSCKICFISADISDTIGFIVNDFRKDIGCFIITDEGNQDLQLSNGSLLRIHVEEDLSTIY